MLIGNDEPAHQPNAQMVDRPGGHAMGSFPQRQDSQPTPAVDGFPSLLGTPKIGEKPAGDPLGFHRSKRRLIGRNESRPEGLGLPRQGATILNASAACRPTGAPASAARLVILAANLS